MIDRPSAFLCVLTASLTVLFYFFPLPKHAIKLPESKGSKGGSEIPPDQRIMDLDKQIHFFGKVLGKDPGEATGHPEFGPLEGVPQSEQIPKENEEKGEEEKNKEDNEGEEDKKSEQSSLTNKLIPVVTKKNKRSKGIKVNTENEESNKEKEKLNKEIKEVENKKEQVRQEKKEEKKKEKKDDKKRKEFEKK